MCGSFSEDLAENVATSQHFKDDMGLESALQLLSIQPDTIDVEVIETEVIKEVEKYSYQTCKHYASVCERIPTCIRLHVVQKISMKVAQKIVDSTSNQADLKMLFDVALSTGISARNMAKVIEEWKASKSLGETLIERLPEVVEGDRNDKARIEYLIFEIKSSIEATFGMKQKEMQALKVKLSNLESQRDSQARQIERHKISVQDQSEKFVEDNVTIAQAINEAKERENLREQNAEFQKIIESLKQTNKNLVIKSEQIAKFQSNVENEKIITENVNLKKELDNLRKHQLSMAYDNITTSVHDRLAYAIDLFITQMTDLKKEVLTQNSLASDVDKSIIENIVIRISEFKFK